MGNESVVSRVNIYRVIYHKPIWQQNGVLGNLAFSILASIFVTGVLYCINPLNVYMILLGFVLYIVSEILEYGFGLQNEVDEML